MFPTRLRFFAFGLTSTLPLCRSLGFRLRLRLRLSLRLWLCNAFTSWLLLLSRRTLSLRRLTSFLTAIRLLHDLPLRRWLSLWRGLSFFLTAIYTRRLLHNLPLRRLSLWRGLPSFLASFLPGIHTRLLNNLPLWCGLSSFLALTAFLTLTAIDFGRTLIRLSRSFHRLRGSTIRLIRISTSSFILHVELLTLASIRHGLNAQ